MKAQTARQLRRLHHYVGLFFAPAILFFAFSGALQTIGLHENHGPGPQPPTWIRWVASVHKDQRPLKIAPAKPEPSGPAPQKDEHAHDHEDGGPSPVPMKAFVLLLSIGLIISSLLGVTIALTNRATRRSSILALAFGAVTPLILLYL